MVNYKDHNHTFPAGADFIAATIVAGLKAFQNSPFTLLLSAKGQAIAAAEAKYVTEPQAALQPSDIPRHTQIGSGPIPDASKAAPPDAINEKLPTLWLMGDSTVRNGSFGDGTNMNQWGWGAPLVAYFDLER